VGGVVYLTQQKSKPRTLGRDRPNLPEIVVTPEMAAAGAAVIAASGMTEHPIEGVDDLVAADIYRAMRRLEPPGD
jgi:hypothetical protein